MNDIVNIISTVGFPISSCLLYMYYIYKDKNQTREENLKREDKFNDTLISMDKRLEHIENNLNK